MIVERGGEQANHSMMNPLTWEMKTSGLAFSKTVGNWVQTNQARLMTVGRPVRFDQLQGGQ